MRKAVWTGAALLCWVLPGYAKDAAADRGPAWPDTIAARVEAVALLQTLNADLLSHDSATTTLEHWCEIHRLASPAKIVALRVLDPDKPATPDQRRELGAAPTDVVRYRRVKLLCGAVVLSEADNWYVPARLPPEMNAQLEATDTPFGKVVKSLHFQRHTLSSTLLWSPLPEGWEMEMHPIALERPSASMSVPHELLRHRALLTLPDGTAISEVVETYTAGLLAFPMAPAAGTSAPSGTAEELIAHYAMKQVPQEGIWFALTYLSEDRLEGAALPPRFGGAAHASGNAIVAVATLRDFSALHRLRSDEVWHFYAGSPLEMLLLYPDGHGRRLTLGPDVLAGELPQVAVPHGVWQGAAPRGASPGAYSLFGTQLSPGFDYADFEPGYRDELQRRYPAFAGDIAKLTRGEFASDPKAP